MSVRDDVLAALPPGRWVTAIALWERMDWSHGTILSTLRRLTAEGIIEADPEGERPFWISARATRYRRRA